MCEPVTISAGVMWAMAGVAAVATGAAMVSAKKTAKAQVNAINAANATQADQIADAAGAAAMQRSREARREVGEARASASEAGINLGSNSFLAVLQNSMFNQTYDGGLIATNEKNQQAARQSEYTSRLASIQIPTNVGIGLSMANAGIGGYMNAYGAAQSGVQKAGAG